MDIAYLKECFEYRDGNLYWLERPSHHFPSQGRANIFNAKYKGKKAGTLHKTGYYQVSLQGKKHKLHRIIWALCNNEMPTKTIDHINRNKADNRIENLRHVTQQENCQNMSARNNGKVSGVYLRNQRGFEYWYASIAINGVKKHLVSTKDFFEAVCARKSAELKYYGA